MKKTIRYAMLIFMVVAVSMTFAQCTDKTQKMIEDSVVEINQQCPVQLDQLTRLDNSEALPGHIMKYNYTLLFSSSTLPDTVAFKEGMTPVLLYKIQTNDALKTVRDLKVTFAYSYKDEKGNQIANIAITPEEYNKPIIEPKPFDLNNIGGGDIQKALQEISASLKKQMPIEMKEQRLSIIDCSVTEGNTIQYVYKLHDETAAKFDSIQYKKAAYTNAIETLKGNAAMKALSQQGVSIDYVYQDKDGKYLCKVIISSKDLN